MVHRRSAKGSFVEEVCALLYYLPGQGGINFLPWYPDTPGVIPKGDTESPATKAREPKEMKMQMRRLSLHNKGN